jgi:hypothetical protein
MNEKHHTEFQDNADSLCLHQTCTPKFFYTLLYTSQYFLLVANWGVVYLQYYTYSGPLSMVQDPGTSVFHYYK